MDKFLVKRPRTGDTEPGSLEKKPTVAQAAPPHENEEVTVVEEAEAGSSSSSSSSSSAPAPAPAPSAAAEASLLALGIPLSHASSPFLLRELRKPYFPPLLRYLAQQRAKGPVYPPAGRELACLSLFPAGLEHVRCVILGQDPYHGPGQANGLAFSVTSGTPLPPSLRNIFKELGEDVGGGSGSGSSSGGLPPGLQGSLEGWARAGVLLLNTTLTVSAGAANSHAGQGWETFTSALIAEVARASKAQCVFVLWGKPAQDKRRLIAGGRGHLILEAPHPSPLSAFRGFFGSVSGVCTAAAARTQALAPPHCHHHLTLPLLCRSPSARPMPSWRARAWSQSLGSAHWRESKKWFCTVRAALFHTAVWPVGGGKGERGG